MSEPLRNSSHSTTMRLRYPDNPTELGRITSTIGEEGGSIRAVDIVNVDGLMITRDITFNANDVEHGEKIVGKVKALSEVDVVNVSDRTFLLHLGGKIEISSKVPVKTRDDLSHVYTPGVARICRAIYEDPESAFALTIRRNTVAVVSDGSAVLGMGDIGPRAAMPVMEGKALLFKEFAGVDAFPICLDTKSIDRIVETCRYLAPSFGGINLEDISSPRCMEIEGRLSEILDIPVFHDDQHGTAVVVTAALTNALKIVDKKLADIKIVICGAGAAGIAIAKLLKVGGARNIIVCDRHGTIYGGRSENMNPAKQWLAENTNSEMVVGSLADALTGADVFVGVSSGNTLSESAIRRMSENAIVFALANPDPEIIPQVAAPYVKVMATGRSDYPNQINNVLCFPGFFRGLLDSRAKHVTTDMKLAAANAIARVVPEEQLRPDYVIPSVFDRRVSQMVAEAVSKSAEDVGVARRRQK